MGLGNGSGSRGRRGRVRARRRRTRARNQQRRRRQQRQQRQQRQRRRRRTGFHHTRRHRTLGSGSSGSGSSCHPCLVLAFFFCGGVLGTGAWMISAGANENTTLLVFGILGLIGGLGGIIAICCFGRYCQKGNQGAENVEEDAANDEELTTVVANADGTTVTISMPADDPNGLFTAIYERNSPRPDDSQWDPPAYPHEPNSPSQSFNPTPVIHGDNLPYPPAENIFNQDSGESPPPAFPAVASLYLPLVPPLGSNGADPPPPSYDDVMHGAEAANFVHIEGDVAAEAK